MAINSDDLRREASALPDIERADLAVELLVSLEAPADEDPSVTDSACSVRWSGNRGRSWCVAIG